MEDLPGGGKVWW